MKVISTLARLLAALLIPGGTAKALLIGPRRFGFFHWFVVASGFATAGFWSAPPLACAAGEGLAKTAADKPVVAFELAGGGKWAEAVVFSRDLNWAATKGPSGKVQVWDVGKGQSAAEWSTDGKEEADPRRSLNRQPQIAFIPGRSQLLVAAATNLAMHELLTGKIVRRLESPPKQVIAVTISPAGNHAVGWLENSHLLVFWNLDDGQISRQMPTTRYPWESGYRTGRRPLTLPISVAAGFCRAFSPDGELFAVGLESSQVDLWNLGGSNYLHYLDTVFGPGKYGLSTSGRAEMLAFLDRQRLAVVYNREQLAVLTLNTNDAEVLQSRPRMLFKAKNPAGELVTGEVVADAGYKAIEQVRELGLEPFAVESRSVGQKAFAYSTNANGLLMSGNLQATNSADATAQLEKLGLTATMLIDLSPQSLGQMPQDQPQGASVSLLRSWQTLIRGPGLEICSLAVSGDGRRLAVAGMRMGWRRSVFAPVGDGVYDVPLYGEVQVWDTVDAKLLRSFQGRPTEKFGNVALDESGQRVAAVTTGVAYHQNMTGTMQQGAERSPAGPLRVSVWDLPGR